VYEELAGKFAFASDRVSIGKVDADEHKTLGKRFGVQGFPTLKWFDGKSDSPEDYQGGRDLESLSKWITDKTGIKPKSHKAIPSAVEILTDVTFEKEIGGDKDVLVAFTAPWCGHCKSLAPTWEALAQDFALEPSVKIAKVDAEADDSKATAHANGVTSYPTIKYFPKGSTKPQAYEGPRSEEALVTFINEHAGTYRTVGGGLNTKAGTIEVLDTVITKWFSAGDLRVIQDEAKAVAAGIQGKYAEYYVKVLNKLELSKSYVEKELKRLESLLEKGVLAPEKMDDLTSRSNILRKFKASEGKDEL